jgi:hypothetical protein
MKGDNGDEIEEDADYCHISCDDSDLFCVSTGNGKEQ